MVPRVLGQFRAKVCPLCAGDNGDSKWTCQRCTLLVDTHRSLLRNLQQWRSCFESAEVSDIVISPIDGQEYSLWDIERFYGYRSLLPDRQRLSMQYCLYENRREADAAVLLGIKPTNPVSIYATIGLTSLLTKAYAGELENYVILLGEPVHG